MLRDHTKERSSGNMDNAADASGLSRAIPKEALHTVSRFGMTMRSVGGLYGIALGQMFFGESMFSKVSDASKVAFYHLQQYLLAENFSLIDCQMMNPHLETLGVRPMARAEFLARLRTNRDKATKVGPWSWAQTLPETKTITDHNQQPQIKVDTGQ
jgi:hypothetical protein